MIDKIPDPQIQHEYIKKYLEFQKQERETREANTNQYSLKPILDQPLNQKQQIFKIFKMK